MATIIIKRAQVLTPGDLTALSYIQRPSTVGAALPIYLSADVTYTNLPTGASKEQAARLSASTQVGEAIRGGVNPSEITWKLGGTDA